MTKIQNWVNSFLNINTLKNHFPSWIRVLNNYWCDHYT